MRTVRQELYRWNESEKALAGCRGFFTLKLPLLSGCAIFLALCLTAVGIGLHGMQTKWLFPASG